MSSGEIPQTSRGGEARMVRALRRLLVSEEGQGMAEYGLILALIAVVVMGVLFALGGQIREVFQRISDKFGEGLNQSQ